MAVLIILTVILQTVINVKYRKTGVTRKAKLTQRGMHDSDACLKA